MVMYARTFTRRKGSSCFLHALIVSAKTVLQCVSYRQGHSHARSEPDPNTGSGGSCAAGANQNGQENTKQNQVCPGRRHFHFHGRHHALAVRFNTCIYHQGINSFIEASSAGRNHGTIVKQAVFTGHHFNNVSITDLISKNNNIKTYG